MKRLLTLSLFLACFAATSQTVTRKAVLVKGQQFERLTNVGFEFEMKVMGQTETMTNGFTRTMTINVDQVLDTAYVLSSKTTRKTEKQKATGKDLDFDSQKPADTAHQAEWNKFIKGVGDLATVVVSKNGYTISRGDTTEDRQDDVGIMASLNAGEETGKKTHELFADLPLKAVQVGETWLDSTISDKSQEHCRYTLTSLTDKEGVIAVNGTVNAETEIQGETEKIIIKVQVKSKGTIFFDPVTGLIKKKEDSMTGEGTFTVRNFVIPMTVRGTNNETIRLK